MVEENGKVATEKGQAKTHNHEPGNLLHHHVHVVFKNHLDRWGEPRQVEGKLFTILQVEEPSKVGETHKADPRDLSKKVLARPGDYNPGRTQAGADLHPYRIKNRKKTAWLGELVQIEPTFKAERLLLPTDRPLELAEDVNYSKTPQGALRLGLILLAILSIVEWWQLSAIKNSQGLDTGQLTSNWAYFFWGCLLFGGVALMALARTKSGRRLEFHCDPRYSEFCTMGNHVGLVGNSRQRSILQQAVDFIDTFDYPLMEALRETLIIHNRKKQQMIDRLNDANQEIHFVESHVAHTDWANMSRLKGAFEEEMEPNSFQRKKLPDWAYLVGFLAFLALVIILYPGSGGGG